MARTWRNHSTMKVKGERLDDESSSYSTPHQSISSEMKIGCMICKEGFVVACTATGQGQLEDYFAADVPVTDLAQKTSQSPCGMKAVNGNCPNLADMQQIQELIQTDSIPGVQLK